jgi:hypothetical protein
MTPSEKALEALKMISFKVPASWCTCDPEVGKVNCEGCDRRDEIVRWTTALLADVANGPTHLDAVINREWCNMLCYREVADGLFVVHQRLGIKYGESAAIAISIDSDGVSELRLYTSLLDGWTLVRRSPTIRDVGALVRMIDPQNEQVHVHTPAPQKNPSSSPVIQDIVDERVKQIERGYGPEHDDKHVDGKLIKVARVLLANGFDDWGIMDRHGNDRDKILTIAASLIVAERERKMRWRNRIVTHVGLDEVAPLGKKEKGEVAE